MRHAMHMTGLTVLGATAPNPASDYGDGAYGPLSPDQLAQLDRKLTPSEQAAVDAWQGKTADAQLAAERAKGGPQSATVAVTPQGAVIKSLAAFSKPSAPWWEIALIVVGGLAVAGGAYTLTRKGRR